jgi:hypothetical protein
MDAPYQIRNWISLYERYNTRDREGPLPWVSLPTSFEGCSFEVLIHEKDGLRAFGIFVMLVQMAGRRSKDERGILEDDLGPITPAKFAKKWLLPIDEVEHAFALLKSSEVMFIDQTPIAKTQCNTGGVDGGQVGAGWGADGGTVPEERIGEDRKREKRKLDPPPGFIRFWQAWPSHHRKDDKQKCIRKWISNDLEALTEVIVEDVTRRRTSIDWTKDNGQFIPAPLTYINKGTWEAAIERKKTAFQFSTEVRHA